MGLGGIGWDWVELDGIGWDYNSNKKYRLNAFNDALLD